MSSYSEGQTHQLMEALEVHSFTPAQVTALGQNSNGVLNQLLLVLTGAAKVVVDLVFRLVEKIDRNMEGWECIEPVQAEGEFEPDLVEFLRPKEDGKMEDHLGGEEMIKRAREQGVLTGLRHAEAMLRNQERIPVEWRKYCLVFSEVWRSPFGSRDVWYLSWDGEQWYLFCRWLSDDFYSYFRLVASRKCQQNLDS